MAVVQISRIQVRRGKKGSGTSIPQLASGEIAWAIDTQELYIGNGSVSEGAPAVGNTKIITQNDLTNENAFLDLLVYAYKLGDPTIAGASSRRLQDRLDDRVISTNFGTLGNGVLDNSVPLQRAIDQLFLNPASKASADTVDGANARVVLELPPGIFKFTQTLLIPSFTTIVGAGEGKTILQYEGTGTAIQFINDTSTIGNPSTINTTLGVNQPRYISISNLTIHTATNNQVAMKLDCVRNSHFSNIAIEGEWESVYSANSRGLEFNALSSLITCNDNTFNNVSISGFSHAVYAKGDIVNNIFNTGYISDVRYGFNFGDAADGVTTGQQYGPRETQVRNFKFNQVKFSAVYLYLGTENTISNCIMYNVGNNGNGNLFAQYPQIYFRVQGNYAHNIRSDRTEALSSSESVVNYIPEVAGHGKFILPLTKTISLGYSGNYETLFRLPLNTDAFGVTEGTMSYSIEYVYTSTYASFVRRGIMTLAISVDDALIQLSDEYDYAGSGTSEDSLKLDFQGIFLDEAGDVYTGAPGQTPYTLCVNYINTLASDAGIFTYTYNSIF